MNSFGYFSSYKMLRDSGAAILSLLLSVVVLLHVLSDWIMAYDSFGKKNGKVLHYDSK